MALTDEELGITPVGGGLTTNPISGGPISAEDAALGITPVGSFNAAYDAALGVTPPGGIATAFGSELGRGLVRGFFNVGGGIVGTTEWLIPGKQESLIEAKRKIEAAKADYSQEYGNWAGWAGRVIGEAFPYMGAALTGGYAGAAAAGGIAGVGTAGLTGAAAAATAATTAKVTAVGAIVGSGSVAFAIEGQNAFDDAITTGATESEANAERLIIGTINAAIEAAQIRRIMRFHRTGAGSLRSFIRNARNRTWDLVKGDAKQFGGQVLNHALTEALEEAAQEGVSLAVPAALRGQIPRRPNGMVDWNQVINRAGFSAAAGGLVGGILGGGGALVGAATEIGRPSNREIDKAIARVDEYNIPAKEKERWKAELEESRMELRFGEDIETPAVAGAETVTGVASRYKGKIFTGATHHKTWKAAAKSVGKEDLSFSRFLEDDATYVDGFITSTGRFVSREEATKIVDAAKQPRDKMQDEISHTDVVPRTPEVARLLQIFTPAKSPFGGLSYGATLNALPELQEGYVRLYRAEHPTTRTETIPSDIEEFGTEDYGRGGFFTTDLDYALRFFEDKGRGAQMVYMDVPKTDADTHFLRNIEDTKDEYFFPEMRVIPKTPDAEIPAFNRQYDQDLVRFAQEIDTSRRVEHEATIKKEKGKRIAAASELLKDETISPNIRAHMARKHLAGELALRFPAQMKLDENQITYYKQRVLTAPLSEFDMLNADEGLSTLLIPNENGEVKLPEPKQIEALEEVFGPEFAKALHKLRAENVTLSKKVIDALNLPRAVLASFDFSAAGRQGLMLLPIAPKQWFRAVKMGYRAWTSPEYASFIELQIKSDPFYKTFKNAGGFLSAMGSILKGEEVFISELAHRIPGIPASERAYTTTLNSLRFYTFKKYAENWQGTGKSHEDYVLLANFINHVTGRGSVKGLEDYMPALNALFFAPRLTMGRIQALGDLFKGATGDIKAGKFSPTRKIIVQDLLTFFLGGAGILGLLSLMKGVDVEKDPRSSDFGKVRFGNTRFDFWGGYSQISRLVAQLISAKAKGTETGRIMPTDRGQVIWRYVQSKLSPASGMSVDLVRGETFIGKQLEFTPEGVSEQVFERFTPLFIQDVVDAARYQGLTTAGIVTPLAMHGIGAMTYPVRPSTEALRIKDVKSRQAYGLGWDEIGSLAQSYIRERNPDIELLERQARSERENFDMVARRLEEQNKVTRNIIKKLPIPIRNDIGRLDVVIPGLSRYVSNGWYLNDKRYKVYQEEIQKGLTQYLTRLRSRPLWQRLPDNMKATLIEDVAKMVRDQVRSQLLMQSQIEDFQRIK